MGLTWWWCFVKDMKKPKNKMIDAELPVNSQCSSWHGIVVTTRTQNKAHQNETATIKLCHLSSQATWYFQLIFISELFVWIYLFVKRHIKQHQAHKATSGTCWEPRGSLKPFSQDIGWLALQAKCSSGGTNQNSWDWHLWISLSAKSAVGRQKRWEGKCVHPKVSLWIASCDRFSWATVTGQVTSIPKAWLALWPQLVLKIRN